MNAVNRQSLDFIEHDHGIGQLVHTPRPARACTKQGFEQLNHGGVNHGGIPILGQHLLAPALLFGRQIAMVLKDDPTFARRNIIRFENTAYHVGVLIDDRGERDDVNHPIHVPLLGVMQSEAKTGKRLATASRYGQRVDAWLARRTVETMAGNIGAQLVYRLTQHKGYQVVFKTTD